MARRRRGTRGRGRGRRALTVALVTGAVIAAAGVALSRLTVASSALIARPYLDRGARRALRVMSRHAPDQAATEHIGVPVGHARMDVYLPDATGGSSPVPAVVWVHGGAWISGRSSDVAPYLRLLTRAGIAAIAVDYSIAPEAVYPTPLHEVNAVLAETRARAGEWGIDPGRLVLAGDSAGAQIVTQLLTLILDRDLARALELEPAITPADVRGLIVHSGVFNIAALAAERSLLSHGLVTAMWAYTGAQNWAELPTTAGMSVSEAVSAEFPPVLMSAGDADPLTVRQSHPFRDALVRAGVPVTALFWEDTRPRLGHEYQFDLDREQAQHTLASTIAFVLAVTDTDADADGTQPGIDAENASDGTDATAPRDR